MSSENLDSEQSLLDLTGVPYRPLTGVYDEMLDADGEFRPGWKGISGYLGKISHQEIIRLQRESSRRLKEQGVYYNVYDDPEGVRRTWKLDPLPLLIPEKDWARLESGLAQRARLMSMLLSDIYGEQRCIKESWIPPEIIFQHPGYLSSCTGAVQQPLTIYAVDVARGPDGAWWALSDRTQGPSGAGYVLEARLVTRQVLGAQAGDLSPAPLAQFYLHLKRHLTTLASDQYREPTIVLLSPGIGNEVYFEHAYMAAQLGITLVQGDDLTVRQGLVYLKTVDDLKKVDVIIRRVDDSYCDPLSLRPDSMLGVPGLLQAQILGKVGMANPLGSSVLESPALLPFLHNLARHFLGEDLKLPDVASWWCGQPKELDHVLQNFDSMVIKTLDRSDLVAFGAGLSAKQKSALKQRIKAAPWRFVGQQCLSFSTIPTLGETGLHPRHMVLRGFAAGDGKDYDILPGGLARVAADTNTFVVSGQKGGSSKDTWILRSSGSIKDLLRLRPSRQRRTAAAILTSRAAENLFWMARYNERTESLLRLIRAYVRRLENAYDFGFESSMEVLKALRPMLSTYCYVDKDRLVRLDSVQSLVLNSQRMGSVSFNLNASIRSAYTVRDLWSGDCWRMVEEIEGLLQYSEKNWALSSMERFTQPFLSALLGFWGAASESMSEEQGGLWLGLGRRIERALNTLTSILNTIPELEHDQEGALREMLLEAHDSLNSHRRRFGTDYSYFNVWQHLLLEPGNPRSLLNATEHIGTGLEHLHHRHKASLSILQKQHLALQTKLRLADAAQWRSAELVKQNLAPFLLEVQSRLLLLGQSIENQYFKHAQPVTRLG
jgi:uncharacterized circularly permuted ATP-grasp superfamily protein/uncharacterized alpha-E superfamily protein